MSKSVPRDPWLLRAPWLSFPVSRSLRIALFCGSDLAAIDPAISATIVQAGKWLELTGCHVEFATPPAFTELAKMFFSIVKTEEGEGTSRAIDQLGGVALRQARRGTMATAQKFSLDEYVKVIGRRTTILRAWQEFLEDFDALLLPISYQLAVPFDEDQKGDAAIARMLAAHEPMLAISMLGLPSLAIPTGKVGTLPVGLQVVSGRFKEEICLRIGEMIEAYAPPSTPIDPNW
jgi:amidase